MPTSRAPHDEPPTSGADPPGDGGGASGDGDGDADVIARSRREGGYTVIGKRTRWDEWNARPSRRLDVLAARDLGARPAGPEDRAAWKKAGSPDTWKVGGGTTLSTRPGASTGATTGTWTVGRRTATQKQRLSGEYGYVCGRLFELGRVPRKCEALYLTPEQGLAGATDLKTAIRKLHAAARQRAAEGGLEPHLTGGFAFLTGEPALPADRAATFRVLARQDDIRSIGTVRDVKGRPGIGLASRGVMKGSGSVYEYQLILDPDTKQIMGSQKILKEGKGAEKGMRPGTVLSYQVVLDMGWTDEKPDIP